MSFTSRNLIRTVALFVGLSLMLAFAISQPGMAHSQGGVTPTPFVYLEAIKYAKVRAGPGVNFQELGQINNGTTYHIVGRGSRLPWYLIALPTTLGWVYAPLVTVTGDINTVPYDSTIVDVSALPSTFIAVAPTSATSQTAAPSLTPGGVPDTSTPVGTAANPAATDNSAVSSTLTMTATATGTALVAPLAAIPSLVVTGIKVRAIESANVRNGPGLTYTVVGKMVAGQSYAVLRRHAIYAWIEILFPDVAGQRAWVSQTVVTVIGDLKGVPTTNDTNFNYPTLTPTSLVVVTTAPQFTVTPLAGENTVIEALGKDIYTYLLSLKFDPHSDRQASVFVMNLQTGHMESVNPNVAFTGASLMKIPVLLAFYRKIGSRPVSDPEARLIANMMVCSDNASANALLQEIGDGNELQGTSYVTSTVNALGMTHTLLGRSFVEPSPNATPTLPSTPSSQTGADQQIADADPLNQTTPADIGILLSQIYQCGIDSSGPILQVYPNEVNPAQCRQILNVMKFNKINAMMEAGVPAGITVAHKQGVEVDTHSDAGIVFTPGGNYVLVTMLHNKGYLDFKISYPALAEISRLTYNAFNASRTLDAIHPGTTPQCTLNTDILQQLQTPEPPPIQPQ